jgi:hypothetical protein
LSLFLSANNGNGYFGISTAPFAYTFGTLVETGTGIPRTITHSVSLRVDVWTFFTYTYDGDKMRIYRDGILGNTSPSYPMTVDSWNTGTGYCGKYPSATYSFNGNIRVPFVLNRCWSAEEVAAYYSLAKSAMWKTDYDASTSLADEGGVTGQYLSNTPWQCGDTAGRWRISLDTIQGKQCKVIECITSGLLYLDKAKLQQEAGALAWGEWDFWLYHGAVAGSFDIVLNATIVALPLTTGQYGYVLGTGGAPAWQCYGVNNGIGTGLYMTGPAGSFPFQVWHKLELRRSVAGVFTFYLDDGLASTVGGSGTNPMTDTAHLSGNYIVIRFRAGDKISLGAIDGSNAFCKRLKG